MKSCCAVVVLLAAGWAYGQDVYPSDPDWTSADTQVSTGAALVDLDHDGWLDFVVANGNDIHEQRVVVYYNQGDGTFPTLPNWQSNDLVYNGHLDVADVNGDGWLDVAVATLGYSDNIGPFARLYLNNAGTLSTTPDWTAHADGNAFAVAFGDVNNDGRPDLAVATGWAYTPQNPYHNFVYMNVDGAPESTPSWTSSDQNHYQGVTWVDADQDGWLDLAFAAAGTSSRVYRNVNGTIETTASWSLTDVSLQDAIMLTAGDINGDALPELIIADNNQIGGSGRFRQYDGQAGDLFATTASWTYNAGYCSAVALADLNVDGRLDLMTGAWWAPTRLFYNFDGTFILPNWSSTPTSVIEKIVFGDIDKNGLRTVQEVFSAVPGGQRLFQLSHRPIQEVLGVIADGVVLSAGQYHVCRTDGWLTIGVAAEELVVECTVSTKLDMAVTNWDSSVGNFVYYSQFVVTGDANCDGAANFDDINPFVLLLAGGYDDVYPDCDGDISCDFDDNGIVNFDDINGFVDALVGNS